MNSLALPCRSQFAFLQQEYREKGERERVIQSKSQGEQAPWLPELTRLCKQNKCSERSSREQQGTLLNEQWHVQRAAVCVCVCVF